MIIVALLMFLKPTLPVLDYAINYNYISKVLCKNKDKPKMHCNGKCHLMKELAKASEQEKPIFPNKKTSMQEQEVLFFHKLKSLIVEQIYFQNTTSSGDNYTNLYFYMNSCSTFHPPTLA